MTSMDRRSMRRLARAISALAPLALGFPASAQLSIVRSTIDGGGGASSGAGLGLGGSIGQPDAGVQAGAALRLGGGFWFGGAGTVVAVADPPSAALRFALHPSYPNPFNPTTTIAFDLPEPSRVDLRIYNARGELIDALVTANFPAGKHRLVWRGRDQHGAEVASGIYFLHLSAGSHSARQKLTLVR